MGNNEEAQPEMQPPVAPGRAFMQAPRTPASVRAAAFSNAACGTGGMLPRRCHGHGWQRLRMWGVDQ